jgi:hypothetical protein
MYGAADDIQSHLAVALPRLRTANPARVADLSTGAILAIGELHSIALDQAEFLLQRRLARVGRIALRKLQRGFGPERASSIGLLERVDQTEARNLFNERRPSRMCRPGLKAAWRPARSDGRSGE